MLVLALIATPSEIDTGDICPRPAGWLIVHPLHPTTADDLGLDRNDFDIAPPCNNAAPKRGYAAAAVALIGTALTVRSRRRQAVSDG